MPVDEEAAAFGSAAAWSVLICVIPVDVVSFGFLSSLFFPFDFDCKAFGGGATSFFSAAALEITGSWIPAEAV